MSNFIPKQRVVVIGAGIGGLTTAALLAKQGYSVKVFEKNSGIGGRVGVIKSQGFVFDLGPSWLILPEVLENFFAKFGHKSSDFYRLARLPERAKIFFADGEHVSIPQDLAELESIFESWEQRGGVKIRQLLGKSARMLAIIEDKIFAETFTQKIDLIKPKMLSQLWQLQRITNQFQTWSELVDSHMSSSKARQLLHQLFLPIAQNSDQVPALYAALLAAQFREDLRYPMGGFSEIIRGVAQVGCESGVVLETGEVEQIVVGEDRIVGVKVGGEFVPAEIVIASADYGYVQSTLLPSGWRDARFADWESKAHTGAVMQICLGLKKKIPQLGHHNLFFADKQSNTSYWQAATDDLSSATWYCVMPSSTDWQVAPNGCESLRIIVPIKNNVHDTPALRQKMVTQVIKQLERVLATSIADAVMDVRVMANQYVTSQFNCLPPSVGGLAVTFDQWLWQRPTLNSKLRGLFYVGHSQHPGAGIPLVMCSAGQCAAKVIAHLSF